MELSVVAAIVGMIGVFSGVLLGWVGRAKSNKQETVQQTSSGERLRADVDYIKRGVDETRLELRAQGQRYDLLAERVTRVEESTKSAHHRIEEIKKYKED